MKIKKWFLFTIITTVFWGIWGALIELPEKSGFPATLSYAVWALTMIPPALVAAYFTKWKINFTAKGAAFGLTIGLLGAGGQLVLFQALRSGPAYIVFPIISLSPVATIGLSILFLREKASARGWVAIALALVAILLLSYQEPQSSETRGYLWLILALIVFLAWGIQAFQMKLANNHMTAESIFFYMMLTAVILAPVAILMTDFSQPINWGLNGPYLAAGIQLLNSVGALCLVFAFRHGRAIIVSPLANAGAPVITILLSLLIYAVIPHPIVMGGIVLAVAAALLLAIEPEAESNGGENGSPNERQSAPSALNRT